MVTSYNYDHTDDYGLGFTDYVTEITDNFSSVNQIPQRKEIVARNHLEVKNVSQPLAPTNSLTSNPMHSTTYDNNNRLEGENIRSKNSAGSNGNKIMDTNDNFHGQKLRRYLEPLVSEEGLTYNYTETEKSIYNKDLPAAGDQVKTNFKHTHPNSLVGYQNFTQSGLGFDSECGNQKKLRKNDSSHVNFMLAANKGEPHPSIQSSTQEIDRLEEFKEILLKLINSEQDKLKLQHLSGTQSKNSIDESKIEALEKVKDKKMKCFQQIDDLLARLKELEVCSDSALSNL